MASLRFYICLNCMVNLGPPYTIRLSALQLSSVEDTIGRKSSQVDQIKGKVSPDFSVDFFAKQLLLVQIRNISKFGDVFVEF